MHWWLAQLSCQRAVPWPLWFTHRDRSTWNYGIPLTTSLVTISSWPVWPTPSGLACPLVLRRCKTISSQFLSFIILRTNEFLYFSLPFYSIPLYRSTYIQVINDELDSVFFSQTLPVACTTLSTRTLWATDFFKPKRNRTLNKFEYFWYRTHICVRSWNRMILWNYIYAKILFDQFMRNLDIIWYLHLRFYLPKSKEPEFSAIPLRL